MLLSVGSPHICCFAAAAPLTAPRSHVPCRRPCLCTACDGSGFAPPLTPPPRNAPSRRPPPRSSSAAARRDRIGCPRPRRCLPRPFQRPPSPCPPPPTLCLPGHGFPPTGPAWAQLSAGAPSDPWDQALPPYSIPLQMSPCPSHGPRPPYRPHSRADFGLCVSVHRAVNDPQA